MKVKFLNKEFEFEKTLRVYELLKKLNLNYEEVVVVKNGEVLADDDLIKENEEVEIINVVSGG